MKTADKKQEDYVAVEKLNYMYSFAKSSTIATILAPIISIPLYNSSIDAWRFYSWFIAMAIIVAIRMYIIYTVDLTKDINRNFALLNWAVGLTTFAWGVGWLILIQENTLLNYLVYEIISLTVLFVGMVGYCVNWKTFFSFVLPLKLPEVIFVYINFETIVWPVAAGSLVALYLALKMATLFSKSWEKSISLRFLNDSLVNQLIDEKNASIAANIAKSEFIATASHDLRQPMQAINIYLELINFKNLEAATKSTIQKIKASVEQLNKMFNTLLDISKLDAESVTAKNESFLSETFLKEIQELFQAQIANKNLDIEFKSTNFSILGDKFLLQQILINLISNAIQYTSRGCINVALLSENNYLTLEVKDTGCGISIEDQSLIFKEFYRVSSSRSMHDGLGLGLTIVNRILKIIKAEVLLESQIGKGSRFKVITSYATTAPMNPNNLEESIISKNVFVPIDNHNKVDQPNLMNENSRHIAVIEDDLSLLAAYTEFFTNKGFVVYPFNGSMSQLQEGLLNITQLDFVISDYRLETETGDQIIQKIREEFNSHIPALILTADTSPQHIKLFKKLKIEVLYKPITTTEIYKFINEFFYINMK